MSQDIPIYKIDPAPEAAPATTPHAFADELGRVEENHKLAEIALLRALGRDENAVSLSGSPISVVGQTWDVEKMRPYCSDVNAALHPHVLHFFVKRSLESTPKE